MELTKEQREKIFLEEKLAKEGNNSSSFLVFLLNLIAIFGLFGIFYAIGKLHERKVSIEDLRKAYAGLSPEDMQ